MPLLNDLGPNESLLCKLWRIKEDENILDPEHELNPEDYQIFLKRKANNLKSQFLASRKLIGLINPDLTISYNENIPVLSDNRNISISHSDEIVTILISKEDGIGVDVEKIKNIDKLTGNYRWNMKWYNPPSSEEYHVSFTKDGDLAFFHHIITIIQR